MNEELKRLYQSVILKSNNEPFNFEKRENAGQTVEAYNQICGDRFKLFFEVEEGKISQLSFHGFGCAISKASTSMLVKYLENKPLEEAQKIIASFMNVINAEGTSDNEDFLAFAAAKDFPGRSKCATLAWDAMTDFFKTKV